MRNIGKKIILEWNADSPEYTDWDEFCDELTNLIAKNQHGGWFAEVKNFGWQKLNGHKSFNAMNGKKFLSEILPARCECYFKIYRYGNGFAINNAHHDSPMWDEWYYVVPRK